MSSRVRTDIFSLVTAAAAAASAAVQTKITIFVAATGIME
jgi:hypothetical protein